jgi:excisionase family DNA binding protein
VAETPAPACAPGDPLLSPAEVAALFRVTPKTVTRWEKSGQLRAIRTPGGHRRFEAAEVAAFVERSATRTEQ